jgi:hypothetical protein
VKEFLVEMDNYCDVQRPEVDNKVSIAVTFGKTMRFNGGDKLDLGWLQGIAC